MATSDEQLKKQYGGKPLDDDTEEEWSRLSSRPVLSVTFVDEAGVATAFSYSHFYSLAAVGSSLVMTFSEDIVTITGRKLATPAKDCLMRKLAQHKLEFVEVHPRAEFIDGEVVTGIKIEKKG